jgi:hypothetical protein
LECLALKGFSGWEQHALTWMVMLLLGEVE